jgi:hypothetical protein
MNLLSILTSALTSGSALQALSAKTGLSEKQLKLILAIAIPLLLKKMTSNASNQSGALSLLGALGQHTSKKPLPEQIAEADQTDGGKILLHILGKDNDQAVQSLASQSGLSGNQVNTALGSLAPALLSTLSSATASAGNAGKVDLSDGLDLSDVAALLGGGKVSASPLGLLGGLMGAGKTNKKNEKDNSLNGNDLLSALLSFKG